MVAKQRHAALAVIKNGRTISEFGEGSDQVRTFTVMWTRFADTNP
jgi:hypothetical protein